MFSNKYLFKLYWFCFVNIIKNIIGVLDYFNDNFDKMCDVFFENFWKDIKLM